MHARWQNHAARPPRPALLRHPHTRTHTQRAHTHNQHARLPPPPPAPLATPQACRRGLGPRAAGRGAPGLPRTARRRRRRGPRRQHGAMFLARRGSQARGGAGARRAGGGVERQPSAPWRGPPAPGAALGGSCAARALPGGLKRRELPLSPCPAARGLTCLLGPQGVRRAEAQPRPACPTLPVAFKPRGGAEPDGKCVALGRRLLAHEGCARPDVQARARRAPPLPFARRTARGCCRGASVSGGACRGCQLARSRPAWGAGPADPAAADGPAPGSCMHRGLTPRAAAPAGPLPRGLHQPGCCAPAACILIKGGSSGLIPMLEA
jgi:hypothetical protein